MLSYSSSLKNEEKIKIIKISSKTVRFARTAESNILIFFLSVQVKQDLNGLQKF